MWIVKLGGSLNRDPRLAAWLRMLADLGGGRVAIVPGGGAFADVAREVQAQWHIDDVAAHNMAVLAMAQSAHLLRALEPRLVAATTEDDIRAALRAGRVALWVPYDVLRDAPDELTTWDVTSDSLALRLAKRMHAERLVVVKACDVPASSRSDLQALARDGVLDARFVPWAKEVDCTIDVVGHEALDAVAARLVTHPSTSPTRGP